MNTLYKTITSLVYFSSLRHIIDKANMAQTLTTEGPFTLLGPYDGAFSAYTTYDPDDLLHEFPKTDLDALLSSETLARKAILSILVGGRLTFSDLKSYTTITTLNGKDLSIVGTNGNLIIQNSFMLNSDIECSNGIIHVTDELIQP